MNERDFDQLVASVKQAGAIKRGKLKPGRTIQMDPCRIGSRDAAVRRVLPELFSRLLRKIPKPWRDR